MTARTEEPNRLCPNLILAHPDGSFAARVSRHFRRLGWDVYTAACGPDVRRLARILGPALVVLATELPDESGWLTCDKLVREHPRLKIILVGDRAQPADQRLAEFVGAAGLVNQGDGVKALANEVLDAAVPSA
jgi:DNA-binding response OmpR family regulator